MNCFEEYVVWRRPGFLSALEVLRGFEIGRSRAGRCLGPSGHRFFLSAIQGYLLGCASEADELVSKTPQDRAAPLCSVPPHDSSVPSWLRVDVFATIYHVAAGRALANHARRAVSGRWHVMADPSPGVEEKKLPWET